MNRLKLGRNEISNRARTSLVVLGGLAGGIALAGCGGENGNSGYTDKESGSYNVTIPATASVDPSRSAVAEDGTPLSAGFINEASQPQVDFVGSPEAFSDEACGSIVFPVKESDDDKATNFEVTGEIGKSWEGENGQSCVYPGAENYLSGEGQAAEDNRKAALAALDTVPGGIQEAPLEDY